MYSIAYEPCELAELPIPWFTRFTTFVQSHYNSLPKGTVRLRAMRVVRATYVS